MGLLDQIDPRDVKVAFLDTIVFPTNFAAPANNNATKHRYLLAASFSNRNNASIPIIGLEDINGNLLIANGPFSPAAVHVLQMPLIVGIPGQNGLRLRLLGGAAQTVLCWVQFADLKSQLTAGIFRS